MPPILARRLLDENKIDNQIHLASAEMLFTTSPRLAICGPVVAVIAAAARLGASAFCESRTVRICDERNTALRCIPVSPARSLI
jgi:ABC-type transporter Mla maintaining outer membrane lipid asymmetry permease subunit MlaE